MRFIDDVALICVIGKTGRGSAGEGRVPQEALAFNNPLIVTRSNSNTTVSFFSVDVPNVMIECVKKAEDSNDIIVRMYECYGGRCSATLSTGPLFVEAVAYVDLYERETAVRVSTDKPNNRLGSSSSSSSRLKWLNGRVVDLTFAPFQIVTVRISISADAAVSKFSLNNPK